MLEGPWGLAVAPEGPQGLAAAPERLEGRAAVRVGGGAWPENELKRRSLAAGTAEAGGADTTAIQISHVIHCGHF